MNVRLDPVACKLMGDFPPVSVQDYRPAWHLKYHGPELEETIMSGV